VGSALTTARILQYPQYYGRISVAAATVLVSRIRLCGTYMAKFSTVPNSAPCQNIQHFRAAPAASARRPIRRAVQWGESI